MELILFCVNILLIIAIWKFCVRKTILDHHRDALFDLRDTLRRKYVENSWDLSDPTYKHLRDLINGCLRFTESYSLVSFAYLHAQIQHEDELRKYLKEELEKEFLANKCPDEQFKFVQELREQCTEIIQSYMTFSSGWLFVFSIFLAPVIITSEFARITRRGLGVALNLLARRLLHFGDLLTALRHAVASNVASRVASADLVEEYSYRLGLQRCNSV